ncbi:MAG: type II toxin-antitoxin system RelE/ParE family toxin [Chitinophagaceae bacterium]
MTYTYHLHPLAYNDYYDAYTWYQNKQEELGERFLKAVRNKIEKIALNPKAYSHKSNKSFREAKVEFFPYLIVYKIKKGTQEIFISSIFHTKRNPRKKYRKE